MINSPVHSIVQSQWLTRKDKINIRKIITVRARVILAAYGLKGGLMIRVRITSLRVSEHFVISIEEPCKYHTPTAVIDLFATPMGTRRH